MKTEVKVEEIKKEIADLEIQRRNAEAQLHAITGAIQICNQLLEDKPDPKNKPSTPTEEKREKEESKAKPSK